MCGCGWLIRRALGVWPSPLYATRLPERAGQGGMCVFGSWAAGKMWPWTKAEMCPSSLPVPADACERSTIDAFLRIARQRLSTRILVVFSVGSESWLLVRDSVYVLGFLVLLDGRRGSVPFVFGIIFSFPPWHLLALCDARFHLPPREDGKQRTAALPPCNKLCLPCLGFLSVKPSARNPDRVSAMCLSETRIFLN